MTSVFVEHVFAYSFRNLKSLQLVPSPKLNIFYGKNGQGKTNLLEAICLGTSLKTIKSVKNKELILFGQEQSRIKTSICGLDTFTVEVNVNPQGKNVQVSNKKIRNASAICNKVVVVTFVPDDLNIVTGSASFRRNLLDQTTSGFFPIYLALYRRFEKALAQRNRLLKNGFVDQQQLASFNEIFAQTAAPVIKHRLEALEILRPEFQTNLASISANTFLADLQYKSTIEISDLDENQIKEDLLNKLAVLKQEELARKTTLCGPHLDDINITIDTHPARHIASRGQARAIILALKTAQIKCTQKRRSLTPILLLDDVMGELDQNNALRLLNTIEEMGAQTFITTTHLGMLPADLKNHQTFEIEQGEILQ